MSGCELAGSEEERMPSGVAAIALLYERCRLSRNDGVRRTSLAGREMVRAIGNCRKSGGGS
jgi:hypothetical protein